MSDKSKKIKLTIVEVRLNQLLYIKESWSRREFFSADKLGSVKDFDFILKECSKKDWQIGVLERLARAGVIIRDTEAQDTRYKVYDVRFAEKILENHRNNGLALAHFIFPNEVPSLPDSIGSSNVSATDIVPTGHTSVIIKEENQIEVSAEQLLARLLEATISVKNNQETVLKNQDKFFMSLKKIFEDHFGDFKNLVDSFGVVCKNIEKLENKINGNNKRLDEITSQAKEQRAVFDNNLGTMRKVSEALNNVADSSRELKDLTASVKELSSQIKLKEQNKLSDLGNKLGSFATDLGVLSNMLLEAATKSEEEHGTAE